MYKVKKESLVRFEKYLAHLVLLAIPGHEDRPALKANPAGLDI